MKSYPDFAPQVFNVLPHSSLQHPAQAHCGTLQNRTFAKLPREKMTEDDSRQKDSLRIFVLCVTICVIFCLSLSLLLSSVYRLLLLFCCFGPCSVLRAFRAAASAPGRYSATMSYLPSVELKTFSGSSTPSAPWAPSLSPPGQYWGTILQIKLLAIKCSWNMLEHVKNG